MVKIQYMFSLCKYSVQLFIIIKYYPYILCILISNYTIVFNNFIILMWKIIILFCLFSIIYCEIWKFKLQHVTRISSNFDKYLYKCFNTSEINEEMRKTMLYFDGYTMPIRIGTPAKLFNPHLSLSTSDLSIPYFKCKRKYCSFHKRFNPRKSITFKKDEFYPIKISVENNIEVAFMGVDTIKMNGIKIKKQGFQLNYNLTHPGNNAFEQGAILGLGLIRSGWYEEFSVLANLFDRNQNFERKFGLILHNDAYSGGELSIGGVNFTYPNLFVVKVPTISPVYWGFAISNISLKGIAVIGLVNASLQLNHEYILFPYQAVLSISKILNVTLTNDHYLFIPCENINILPDFHFYINGAVLTLRPKDYVVDSFTNLCFIGILPYGTENFNHIFLGSIFLRRFYTVFDMSNEEISFAYKFEG